MELRHLRYFIAVAEEKHVTRAAERLGMQQPPLSQQIRALERELDVQLFRRKPRGVELTDAGSALLADARAVLSQIDHAFATTKRTARGEQGQIAVGFTSSAPFHPFVPRIIRVVQGNFPARVAYFGGKRDNGPHRLSAQGADRRRVHPHGDFQPGGACRQFVAARGDGPRPATRSCPRPSCRPEQGSTLESPGGRNFHRLPASQRSRALRCDLVGLQRSWVQPARRAGSTPDRVNPEPGCRRPRSFPRPGIAATHAVGWRRVSPLGRRRTAAGSAISCDATWRDVGGGPELFGTGQAARTQRLGSADVMSAHGTLFRRANRAERCRLSGADRPTYAQCEFFAF